jgi:hypothetical protein
MLDDTNSSKAIETKVERYEVASDSETGIMKPVPEPRAMGTVTMTDLNEIFLIPSPSVDPRGAQFATYRWRRNMLTVASDPLNLSRFRKILFVVLLSIFSALGLALVSGFGGLLVYYIVCTVLIQQRALRLRIISPSTRRKALLMVRAVLFQQMHFD